MASSQHRASERRYQFADLKLDLGRRTLSRGNERVPLSNLTFTLLWVLVEQSPQVVTHEELAKRTWGSRRIVTPENLAKRVMLLRQALGDSAEQPRYIERIRCQGYRLIPEVEETADPDIAAAVPAEVSAPVPVEPSSTRARPRIWSAKVLLGAAAGLLLVVGGWATVASLEGRDIEANASSIAVLPFENRSATDEDAGFFAEGIHDDLITRLAAISDLKVTPRASVMDFRGQPFSPLTVGGELSVGAVLDGSVQRAGNQVRVNVHLINARTGETIWGDSYNEELTAENVFAIQEEVATAIATELEAKLTPDEATQISQAPTQNMRALDLYMSGRDYERPPFAYWGMAALQYQRAVEHDPQFALAHARLSLASLLAYYNIDWDRARVETAKKAADEAVRLQPDLPIAHVAKAFYLISEAGDLERAQEELAAAAHRVEDEPQFFVVRALLNERLGDREAAVADRAAALALNPRDPVMMLDIGIWHSRVRHHDEARRLVDRALDIRPDFIGATMFKAELAMLRDGDVRPLKKLSGADFADDPGRRARLRDLQWQAALYERDYDSAIRILDRPMHGVVGDADAAEQWRRDSLPFLLSMATTHRLAGDHEAARELYERGVAQTQQEGPSWLMWRAAFLVGRGRSEEAVSIGRQLWSETGPDGPFASMLRLWLAREVFAPGQADALAIQLLDEYLSRPGSWSIEGLSPDPRFDPIRDDPGFAALIVKHRRR